MPVGEEVVRQDDEALGAVGRLPTVLQGGAERGEIQRIRGIRYAQRRGEGDAAGRGDTNLHHVANLGQATAMVTASALGSSPIRWQRDTFT